MGTIIFALILMGIGAGLFFMLLKPSLEAKNILKNGVETTATLIDMGSYVKKNDQPYYWLKFSFVNSAGKTVTYKTNCLYPEYFINGEEIAEYTENNRYEVTNEPVRVMYMGKKAVIKGFVPKDDEHWALWIPSGVFCAAGLLILLWLVLAPVVRMYPVMQEILSFMLFVLFGFIFAGIGAGVYLWVLKPPMEAAKILKNGVETTATVIAAESNSTINDVPQYYLVLSYVNSEGKKITCKTNSIYDERFLQDMNIAAEKNFTTGNYYEQQVQVMYIGAKAVVKGFVPEKADWWLWIFPVVFGAIGVAIWLALLWGIVKLTGEFIIKWLTN